MTTDLVILIPVLRRPHRVEPLLASIASATTVPYRVLFLVSHNDPAEKAALKSHHADYIDAGPWRSGDYARKINLGYRNSTEPLIFMGADDLLFHPGWFEACMRKLGEGIEVVGTNDLGNPRVMAGEHSTHTLLTRHYADTYGTIDEQGKILNELYPHVFTDDEFIATARYRNAYAFASDSHVEHLHPNWGKAAKDHTYSLANRSLTPGRRIFRSRQHLWGGAQPSISVITPIRPDRKELFLRAQQSVFNQSLQPLEHLVKVDYKGLGCGAIRNQLIARAKGDWVAFLDDDDELDRNHLEVLWKHHHRADVIIPYCRFNGPPIPSSHYNHPFNRQRMKRHGIFPVTVLARKQAILDAGGFDSTATYEDWDLWNRMADRGNTFHSVPIITWTYYRGHDAMTFKAQ